MDTERQARTTKQDSAAAVPALLTKALVRRYYLPIGERTLDRWVSTGVFPKPDLMIGGKSRFWRRETVEGWVDARTRLSEGTASVQK